MADSTLLFPSLADFDFSAGASGSAPTTGATGWQPFAGLSTATTVALGIGALALVLLLIPEGGGR